MINGGSLGDTVHFGIAWLMAPMVMAIWWFVGIIVWLWANSMDIYSSWQLNESRWSSDQDWWTEQTRKIHVDFLQRNWVSFDSTLKGASIFLSGLRLKIWLHPLPSLSVTPRLSATWCIPPGCIQTLKLSSTEQNLCLEGPLSETCKTCWPLCHAFPWWAQPSWRSSLPIIWL